MCVMKHRKGRYRGPRGESKVDRLQELMRDIVGEVARLEKRQASDEDGEWHYDVAFITLDAYEWALRREGRLPVGAAGADGWYLTDPRLWVLPLADNSGVLSQLKYPLTWVQIPNEPPKLWDFTESYVFWLNALERHSVT